MSDGRSTFFSNVYDIADKAFERTRELYNQGMPISDLLKKIDEERFFTPNKKGPYQRAKDFYNMSEWDKDQKWRLLCFTYFFMECFYVGVSVRNPIGALWEFMKENKAEEVEHYCNEISSLIEGKRMKWEGWYEKKKLQEIDLNDYYDKTDTAIERTRELYNQGMSISDLLKKIDEERFFTPNRKGRYKSVKEDFQSMSDRDKDRNWRVECLGYFLMECFHISSEVHELIMTLLWAEKKGYVRFIEDYHYMISRLIEKEKSEWDKRNISS